MSAPSPADDRSRGVPPPASRSDRPSDWRVTIGEVLRERRTDLGLRLTDVAEKARVSTQYLSEVERGRKEASSEILHAVSGALGLSFSDLALAVARRTDQRVLRLSGRFSRSVVPLRTQGPLLLAA